MKNFNELGEFLTLPTEEMVALYPSIKEEMTQYIANDEMGEFMLAFGGISTERMHAFFALHPINWAQYQFKVLQFAIYLSTEQLKILLDAAQKGNIQFSIADFNNATILFDSEKKTLAFNAFKACIFKEPMTLNDYRILYKDLPSKEKSILFEFLIESNLLEVKDFCIYNIVNILQAQTPAEYSLFFKKYSEKISKKIKTKEDLFQVLVQLTPEQCHAVVGNYKQILPEKLLKGEDFDYLLSNFKLSLDYGNPNIPWYFLTPEQCASVLEAYQEDLPNMMHSPEDVAAILKYIPPEKYDSVLTACSDPILKILQKKNNISIILHSLNHTQYQKFCVWFKSSIPTALITSTTASKITTIQAEYLRSSQKIKTIVALCDTLQDELAHLQQDPKYTKIKKIGHTVCVTLKNELKTLTSRDSKTLTLKELEVFKIHATTTLLKFEKIAKIHRGFGELHHIIRKILGILATLTVVPALIVAQKSKHGYVETFFKSPPTRSSGKTKEINAALEELIPSPVNPLTQ